MDDKKRISNEKQFDLWVEKNDGGRICSFEIAGRYGWISKYLKETDADEATMKFWQEIYNDRGNLIEIHEKFPVDKGHKKVNSNDNKESDSGKNTIISSAPYKITRYCLLG